MGVKAGYGPGSARAGKQEVGAGATWWLWLADFVLSVVSLLHRLYLRELHWQSEESASS